MLFRMLTTAVTPAVIRVVAVLMKAAVVAGADES